MAKRKWSFNERTDYHKKRIDNFANRFKSNKNGSFTEKEFSNFIKAAEKNKSIQYSMGFLDGIRGVSGLDKNVSLSEKRGFKAGEKALEKSRNVKF